MQNRWVGVGMGALSRHFAKTLKKNQSILIDLAAHANNEGNELSIIRLVKVLSVLSTVRFKDVRIKRLGAGEPLTKACWRETAGRRSIKQSTLARAQVGNQIVHATPHACARLSLQRLTNAALAIRVNKRR